MVRNIQKISPWTETKTEAANPTSPGVETVEHPSPPPPQPKQGSPTFHKVENLINLFKATKPGHLEVDGVEHRYPGSSPYFADMISNI